MGRHRAGARCLPQGLRGANLGGVQAGVWPCSLTFDLGPARLPGRQAAGKPWQEPSLRDLPLLLGPGAQRAPDPVPAPKSSLLGARRWGSHCPVWELLGFRGEMRSRETTSKRSSVDRARRMSRSKEFPGERGVELVLQGLWMEVTRRQMFPPHRLLTGVAGPGARAFLGRG